MCGACVKAVVGLSSRTRFLFSSPSDKLRGVEESTTIIPARELHHKECHDEKRPREGYRPDDDAGRICPLNAISASSCCHESSCGPMRRYHRTRFVSAASGGDICPCTCAACSILVTLTRAASTEIRTLWRVWLYWQLTPFLQVLCQNRKRRAPGTELVHQLHRLASRHHCELCKKQNC